MDRSSQDPEKAGFEHADDIRTSSLNESQDIDIDAGFTPEEQRKIIRRIDRRLVVTVGAMYCVSLMDRTNLSAAAIAGMTKELSLQIDNRYGIASLLFFIPYIIFQPPSTIVVRKIGPRLHLGGLTLLWGGVMIGMGFSRKYTHLYACRILLGVLEAGFFPSCVYLLSTWYTRYEVGKRYSVFYLLGCVASAFAGILAYGLMQMNGQQGLTGWRWIFIIEVEYSIAPWPPCEVLILLDIGVLTCVLGLAGYWLLVDFPDSKRKDWSFLGERERAWIVARVNRDRGDAHMPAFNLRRFLSAGADWRIWAYAMIFFNTTTVSYALAYFLPIILQINMGFDVGAAQCLVAPPYAFAGFIMFGTAWLGDKMKFRGPVILINMLFCIVGLPIMGFHSSAAVRYFGVFLTTAGANSNVPAVMAYQANNIRGQWKRAFCSATLVSFGGIGGIAGSLLFREQDKPHYRPGMYACIACSLLTVILVSLLTLDAYFKNKKADRGETELEADDEGAQRGFRYTY
ncbi:major facilitator superfamily transporter [Colletotrichum higginsianum]|uniref:Major facilitator superfamily transporter n=1 Tax=Colletotrichum higginsianum (strain IMI 349063) TaxID=759273 RepID=H1UXH3_COLHI|nr:Major facilitator superfamily transporter [Colletotrichum higginsianum IMI 349063]OBR04292.1 Major facilitator superfamily transporter [Colletotrichum higginsianum IMI 349063]CCF32674.1 major facilitator superfamily transporter [Colletotrichum higginsianum]